MTIAVYLSPPGPARDHTLTADGITFVVARDVRELADNIAIDGSSTGLRILSQLGPSGRTSACS